MKIFDLHNDALTCGYDVTNPYTVCAVWTTKLSLFAVDKIFELNKNKMLAIEDCGIFATNIEKIDDFGIKYASLTWNFYNGLAGGAYCDDGLSFMGSQLIERLNAKGVPIDTAHLNQKSFFEVADIAKKIICSHTCFYAINHHPRNLTNEQIAAIIKNGGVIGLCFVGDFLGEPTIDTIIRHVDWFLGRFGDKNLCIGTDFFGTSNLPQNLTSYESFDKLVLAMIRQGYRDTTISNILFSNANAYFNNS
ncbi:MAG: membrane dipeptidase [Clostridia bacterium]|nr:membrane dipeptidase [Clostridia bacterium]